jgi:hypothetical protein
MPRCRIEYAQRWRSILPDARFKPDNLCSLYDEARVFRHEVTDDSDNDPQVTESKIALSRVTPKSSEAAFGPTDAQPAVRPQFV